jgi:predicted MPP superfamily phosphohydrolase
MNEVLVKTTKHHSRREKVKRLFWNAASSIALGGLYAWRIEDHWIRMERHNMALRGLPSAWHGATLVHLSDLHCSPIVLERYLLRCVEIVNRLRPDFVAITGDFITGPMHYARRVSRVLRHLEPRVAAVACLGNHDYGIMHPSGLGETRRMADFLTEHLARADIFVMRNESRVFHRHGAAIQFVGVEDLWSDHYDPCLAFQHARTDAPTIALCHNPDAAYQVAFYGAQWVLSGHVHGRPLKKENPLRKLVLPAKHRDFSAGQYSLGGGHYLYVNRGLGYGRRVLLNARPEITFFTLRGE